VRLLRDTRPNRFYPTAGTLFDLSTNFFSASSNLGTTSDLTPNPARAKVYSYQTYRIIFNKYVSLSKSQVLAYNLYLCGTGGDAPFYGQCIFGVQNELQGYTAGRYIDRYMFATQLEYRLVLPKRFGLVGFGGVGGSGSQRWTVQLQQPPAQHWYRAKVPSG
jgi:outer membrane protein assembly factor BamA